MSLQVVVFLLSGEYMNTKLGVGLVLGVVLLSLVGILGAQTVQGSVGASQDVSENCILALSANSMTLGGGLMGNVIVTNTGNAATSVSISATDWSGSGGSFAPSYTEWSSTGAIFTEFPAEAGTPVEVYPSVAAFGGTGEIYFEASAPATALAGSYQQTITIISGC